MRIKYKSSIYGMSPTCKARPTMKVGSMSCEECEYFRGKAFGFIGKETAVGGRKIDLYGGWVECAAPEMQDEQEEEPVPKPLLADAKVGDLCKTDLDEWIQIDDTSEPPSPILYHYDRPFKGNIIHTEPLAPEGSKEWAVQRMKLGDKVTKGHLSHIYWQYDARPHLKCISEYNCGTLQIMVLPEIWLTTAEPTGWQVYKEPEQPKSAYQVGDFVVCTYYRSPLPQKNSYERVIDVSSSGIVTKANDGCVTEYDINGNHGDINGWHIERLVKPEEYIICIGCLSGTVEKASDFDMFLLWHSKKDCDYSMIRFDALDTRTRELVESLLEAQEEETK